MPSIRPAGASVYQHLSSARVSPSQRTLVLKGICDESESCQRGGGRSDRAVSQRAHLAVGCGHLWQDRKEWSDEVEGAEAHAGRAERGCDEEGERSTRWTRWKREGKERPPGWTG